MIKLDEFEFFIKSLDLKEFEVAANSVFSDPLYENIGGWCSPPTMLLLNTIVSHFMESTDNYLEIGTYRGKSLIAALLGNKVNAWVIDAFEKHLPDGLNIKRIWNENINLFNLRDRITLFEQNCHEFNRPLPPIDFFYYDGNHDSCHTYEALKKFESNLSDNAIIIVDDIMITDDKDTKYPVKTDVDRWLSENKFSKQILLTNWTNGQMVMSYKR